MKYPYDFTVAAVDSQGSTGQADLHIELQDWVVESFEPTATLAMNRDPVEVTFHGYGLELTTRTVYFGEWPAELIWRNNTEIHVYAPIMPPGQVQVFVNGEGVGRFDYFEVAPPEPEPPGPLGVPMHQGRCLCLADLSGDNLTLSNILDLMIDEQNGIIVDTVDLGWPDVRETTGVWADADGTWDFTRFFGARGVSLSGNLVDSELGSRSQAYQLLIPYLSPKRRPALIYCFNADDEPRYIRLRGASYSGAVNNPLYTTFQGQWKAPEALAYSLLPQEAIAVAVEHTDVGRIYSEPQPDPGPEGPITSTSSWEPDRHYPGMVGAVSVNASNEGTAPTWPTFRIHGDCTGPTIFNDTTGQVFAMKPDFQVFPGEVLTINTQERLVYLEPAATSSRYGQVDFSRTTWWPLVPGPNSIRFDPVAAEESSELVVTWQNAYL